jgi:hypothetical protein
MWILFADAAREDPVGHNACERFEELQVSKVQQGQAGPLKVLLAVQRQVWIELSFVAHTWQLPVD